VGFRHVNFFCTFLNKGAYNTSWRKTIKINFVLLVKSDFDKVLMKLFQKFPGLGGAQGLKSVNMGQHPDLDGGIIYAILLRLTKFTPCARRSRVLEASRKRTRRTHPNRYPRLGRRIHT